MIEFTNIEFTKFATGTYVATGDFSYDIKKIIVSSARGEWIIQTYKMNFDGSYQNAKSTLGSFKTKKAAIEAVNDYIFIN